MAYLIMGWFLGLAVTMLLEPYVVAESARFWLGFVPPTVGGVAGLIISIRGAL